MHGKRISCTNQDDCEDEKCDAKQKKIRINIYLSSSFYLVNLIVFLGCGSFPNKNSIKSSGLESVANK